MTPEDRQHHQLIDELKAYAPAPRPVPVVTPPRGLVRALNTLAAAKGTEIHNAAMKR
jgi:hypothetical protein